MKATARTGRRLLITTLLAFIVSLLMVLGVARVAARRLSADRLADVLADAVPPATLASCREGHPRAAAIEAGVTFDFYDRAGRPLYADAPPFDEGLAHGLSPTRRSAGSFDGRTLESRAVMRLPDAEPCAFAQARWRYDGRLMLPFTGWVGAATAIASVVFAALLGLFVARPLLRQLTSLRDAAVRVGCDDFRSAPEWSDEAGEISLALNDAHARIVEEGRRSNKRSNTLEWILAEIGHDMRTPLASIQFALDELAEQLPEGGLAPLRRALSDVVYVRSLTNNLRIASRIHGELWTAPVIGAAVSLSETAQRVVDRSAPFALRRGIDLITSIAPTLDVHGDETASEQALTNLLENAIAHSAPGTTVQVHVERSGDSVRMVVEDDGPGVVPHELPQLGARAFRSNRARGRDGRGTGLGLAITREICERSGWSVRFEPVTPSGLRAIIEAPALRPSSPELSEPPRGVAGS